MSSCEATSGGSTAFCACAIGKIQERMSLEDFKQAEVGYALTGKLDDPRFAKALVDCGAG